MDLTVVIPCLNEEKTIAICIEKCKMAFGQLNIEGEVLVVDNCSTDKTTEVASKAGARVIRCNDRGYGNTLRLGFKNTDAKYVAMGDADNTYDFLEIPLLWDKLAPDVDLVTGTRLKGHIEKGAMAFKTRYFGIPVLTFLLNTLFGTKISDSQCGMRIMKKESLDKINFKSPGMEFASEIFVEFAKHGFKIVETPISLYNDIEGRVSHLRPWRDGFRHLRYLLKAKLIGNR